MFYSQCNNCNERWELGTASTCKCPDEKPVKFAFKENNDSKEVLRVTLEGEFIWHPDADNLIAEGDFSQSPALPHILRALRKQRTWVGLTDEELNSVLPYCHNEFDLNEFREFAFAIGKLLKEKNT